MSDTDDTRDKPVKRRVGRDAYSDWEQERITPEHKKWLQGNGSLWVHHFTTTWDVNAPKTPQPNPEVFQYVVDAYNAKMLQTAIVGRTEYRALFKEMGDYAQWLKTDLAKTHPELSPEQVGTITDICENFMRDWVKQAFKVSFEFAQNHKKSRGRG